MNRLIFIRSILLAAMVLLAASCGRESGESAATGEEKSIHPTPPVSGRRLNRYREKGIEPRRAKFARELEE